MWFIGQTVKHVSTNTPRVYLGVDLRTGTVYFIDNEGKLYQEEGGIPGIMDKYTEYRDEGGKILTGVHACGAFLGIWKSRTKLTPRIPERSV